MATVAVLEMNADRAHVIRPNAITIRVVEEPTMRSDRTRKANRRASPCLSMAPAMMKAPM